MTSWRDVPVCVREELIKALEERAAIYVLAGAKARVEVFQTRDGKAIAGLDASARKSSEKANACLAAVEALNESLKRPAVNWDRVAP